MARVAKSFEDLEVYQRAFAAQQKIFELTRSFPREERFSLTDQIRRSSRSMGLISPRVGKNGNIPRILQAN